MLLKLGIVSAPASYGSHTQGSACWNVAVYASAGSEDRSHADFQPAWELQCFQKDLRLLQGTEHVDSSVRGAGFVGLYLERLAGLGLHRQGTIRQLFVLNLKPSPNYPAAL